jgi:hypothetical protein
MAVGTVSSANDDVWQLISTATPSSAASSSFTSISGYKKLMVVFSGTMSGDYALNLTFNSDTTASNYGGASVLWSSLGDWSNADARIPMFGYTGVGTTNVVSCAIIEYADVATPKIITIRGSKLTVGNGVYLGSAISSVTVAANSGTLTATIKLYGIAA